MIGSGGCLEHVGIVLIDMKSFLDVLEGQMNFPLFNCLVCQLYGSFEGFDSLFGCAHGDRFELVLCITSSCSLVDRCVVGGPLPEKKQRQCCDRY